MAYTASWGAAKLPAGDYSFSLDKSTLDGKVTVYRGKIGVAMILTNAIDPTTAERSEMVLENGTVREVRLPVIGLTLEYPAHNEGRRAAPQEALAAQVTPIIAVGFGR